MLKRALTRLCSRVIVVTISYISDLLEHSLDFALFETMAAKNLYSGGNDGEESSHGQLGSGTPFAPIEEREERAGTFGPRTGFYGMSKLPYDYVGALADRPVNFYATSNRIMPMDDACKKLAGILLHCGVSGQSDAVQLAFHRAILLAHAKNSASVIQPGRAGFGVDGSRECNFYLDVMYPLGNDSRRFFRAWAQMSRDVVAGIHERKALGDESVYDDYRDLMWTARDRGLTRYPHLVADNAEAISGLTANEYTALSQAKATIFENTTNMADFVQTYYNKNKAASTSHFKSGTPAQLQGPDY